MCTYVLPACHNVTGNYFRIQVCDRYLIGYAHSHLDDPQHPANFLSTESLTGSSPILFFVIFSILIFMRWTKLVTRQIFAYRVLSLSYICSKILSHL